MDEKSPPESDALRRYVNILHICTVICMVLALTWLLKTRGHNVTSDHHIAFIVGGMPPPEE